VPRPRQRAPTFGTNSFNQYQRSCPADWNLALLLMRKKGCHPSRQMRRLDRTGHFEFRR
jgi:hypothetical protein